jgi:hypothetical protein
MAKLIHPRQATAYVRDSFVKVAPYMRKFTQYVPPPPPPVEEPPVVIPVINGMELGVNLGGAGTSNAYYPFINLLWNASDWKRISGTGTFVQNQGELVASNKSDFFQCYISDSGKGMKPGRYVVRNPKGSKIGFGAFTQFGKPCFSGAEPGNVSGYFTTSFAFDWPGTFPTGTGLFFIAQGDVSGVELLMPGYEAAWDAGEVLTDEFKAFENGLGRLSPMRTMVWTGTNMNTEKEWVDRTLPTLMTNWKAEVRTVPWERVIQTATKLDRDLWINIPYRASDDYIRQAAMLHKTMLPRHLRVFVEYLNEGWNNFNEFASATSWVTHLYHTKIEADVDWTTGIIYSPAHGRSNEDILRCWSHREDLMNSIGDSDGTDSYKVTRGNSPMYVEVIDGDHFKLWDEPLGNVNRSPAGWSVGRTKVIYCHANEPGKPVDLHRNYAERCARIWEIFDEVFGTDKNRIVAVLGSQAGNADSTVQRLSVPAAAARTNRVAIAPYYAGPWFAGQASVLFGKVTPKIWTNCGTDQGGTAVTYFGIYAQGSNPAPLQVMQGRGAGFIAGSVPWETAYGKRIKTPVTISQGAPAVVTWNTAAPANGVKVTLATSGVLPAPLLSTVTYFVVNSNGSSCNLSATSGGAPIDTVDVGAGSHTASTSSEAGGSYLNGTSITLPDGVYTSKMVVQDPTGHCWMMSQDITVGAAESTVNYFVSFEDQAKMGTITLLERTSPWVDAHKAAIAASLNPSIELADYEGGSHWFNMPSNNPAPPAAYSWMISLWAESVEYANSLRRYLNHLSSKKVKTHAIFVELSDGTISWTLANSVTDITDNRYKAMAAYNGVVPSKPLLDLPDMAGANFPTKPVFPQTVATLPGTGLTYSILKGYEDGNYQIVGNTLVMINDDGVDWSAPVEKRIEILASDGDLDDIFNVMTKVGTSFYMGDEKLVLNSIAQTNPLQLVPIRGGAFAPVGAPGVLSGGVLNLSGASNYVGASAMTEAVSVDATAPSLFMVVVGQAGTVATSQRILDFGGSQFVRLSTSATNPNMLRWRMLGNSTLGGGDTSFLLQPWGAALQVFWMYAEPATNLVYVGRNQIVDNVGGTPFTLWGGNTLGKQITLSATTANPKIGSVLVRKSAELTLEEVLAAVQRVQTLHNIAG